MKRLLTAAGTLVAALLWAASGTSLAQTTQPFSIGDVSVASALDFVNPNKASVCVNIYGLLADGTVGSCASCFMTSGQSSAILGPFLFGTVAVITSQPFGITCQDPSSPFLTPATPGVEVITAGIDAFSETYIPSQALDSAVQQRLTTECIELSAPCPF